MMKRVLFAMVLLLVLGSCGSKSAEDNAEGRVQTEQEAIASFKKFEDSLKQNTTDLNTNQATGVLYANKCLDIYHQFPKSKEAPRYLDKAHIIFSSLGLYRRSVQLADTLLNNYPSYKNRAFVIESVATSYDVFLLPREKDKVVYYYTLLLKENPQLPAERRKEIQDRIDYADMSFEELISAKSK